MNWMTRYKHRYDEVYYERGKSLGVSWYDNYHWEPERSHGEATAFIRTMQVPQIAKVVDFGCAKGFFVRAMVEAGFDAYGLDISDYAREHGDPLVKNRLFDPAENWRYYDVGFCKDTLEHVAYDDIDDCLQFLANVCRRWLLVVPLAHAGVYAIPDYELETTHIIRENADWWVEHIERVMGVEVAALWVMGIKDKWWRVNRTANLMLCTQSKPYLSDADIACHFHCFKNREGTREALASFRAVYPKATVHLISDGGLDFTADAAEFGCVYHHEPWNIGLQINTSEERMNEWLRRFRYVCEKSREPWILILEDDVRVRANIRYPMYAMTGSHTTDVLFRRPLGQYLFAKHPHLTNVGYGGGGGTLVNRLVALKAIDTYRQQESFAEWTKMAGGNASDQWLTAMMMNVGYQYMPNDDVADMKINRDWRTSSAAIVHCQQLYHNRAHKPHAHCEQP